MSGPLVRLSGALPDDEQRNALEARHESAQYAPQQPIIAVAILRVDKIVRDVRGGQSTVVLRIDSIEALDGDDAQTARELAMTALEDRLGVVSLPFGQGDDEQSETS